MDSLIYPKRQSGLQHLFNIKSTQTNPEYLDMNKIQPVIDMSMCGDAKLYDLDKQLATTGTPNISGLQTSTQRILSYGNAVGVDAQIVVPEGHHFAIWGMKYHIQTDAAGAAAWNNKYYSFVVKHFIYVKSTGLWWEVHKYGTTFLAVQGIQLLQPGQLYTPPLVHLGVVPATSYMEMTTWSQDGTNFPANTVLTYSIAGLAVPIGAPVPRGIG